VLHRFAACVVQVNAAEQMAVESWKEHQLHVPLACLPYRLKPSGGTIK
jgi:hypothetical protein